MSRMASSSRMPSPLAIVGALVVVGGAILAGRIIISPPATQPLHGAVTLVESEIAKFDRDVHDPQPLAPDASLARCTALGIDAVIAPGAEIVMYDEEGAVLGRGALGSVEPAEVTDPATGRTTMTCRLPFAIAAVPHDGNLTFGIGSLDRRTYTLSELDAVEWNLEVRVGR
jgi:hypothetical protein